MYLVDGYRTTVTFSLRPGIFLREREVQPPSIDTGGPIDTTVMANVRGRTAASKSLVSVGEVVMQCQYDPFVYSHIIADAGANQIITITFPDGATKVFYGFIDKFTPPSHKEGEFPVAEVRIVPTLRSPLGTETMPTVTAGATPGVVAR